MYEERVVTIVTTPNLGVDTASLDYLRGEAGMAHYIARLPEGQIEQLETFMKQWEVTEDERDEE